MNRLARATEMIGLPVVTLGGEDVAEVRDVVFESRRGDLLGFTLNQRGFFAGRLRTTLLVDDVRAVGHDAVIVQDPGALHERDDAPDAVADPATDQDVIGAPVITEEGTRLGAVADVVMSLGEKIEAVGYELSDLTGVGGHDGRAFVPLPDQLAVSGDALLVPTDLQEFLRDDLTGFGGAIDDYRAAHGRGTNGAPSGADRPERDRSPDDRTKAELYAEARRRDLPGRSSMTKAELASALEREGGR